MSDTSYTSAIRCVPYRESVELPRPDPFALVGPVMIGDAVTPLGTGTLLSHLLARQNRDE